METACPPWQLLETTARHSRVPAWGGCRGDGRPWPGLAWEPPCPTRGASLPWTTREAQPAAALHACCCFSPAWGEAPKRRLPSVGTGSWEMGEAAAGSWERAGCPSASGFGAAWARAIREASLRSAAASAVNQKTAFGGLGPAVVSPLHLTQHPPLGTRAQEGLLDRAFVPLASTALIKRWQLLLGTGVYSAVHPCAAQSWAHAWLEWAGGRQGMPCLMGKSLSCSLPPCAPSQGLGSLVG